MKKIILFTLAISITSSALADCSEAYRKASQKRDLRNEIIVGVAWAGTMAGTVLLASGTVAQLLFVGNTLTIGAGWPITDAKRRGNRFYKNNIDKILAIFESVKSGTSDKFLEKLLKKTERKYGSELSANQVQLAKKLLIEGFDNEIFCPVRKTKADGTLKRSVFNRNALAEYLAQNI